MKPKKKYRKYDRDFKNEVLDQVRSGRSVREVAKSLGISPSLIYHWRKKNEGGSSQKETHELKELRKRVKDLEKDNDVLKKALSIFSQR